MTAEHDNLAEQALANLVNQFARPLDFLRELAQNAMDAGSARIEVSVAYEPPSPGEDEGVLRISVDDWGEGMDEEIIDNQLTRLFSSSKEDDLTKIGKFGIGFTSIFAIQPEAVLLRTGRHGEYWELLFHKDRSFDKVRVDAPVDGTRITLFKRTDPGEIDQFIEECRFILGYWCEHSDTPITFWNRTGPQDAPAAEVDDPFAAFAEPNAAIGSVTINRPLAIEEAALSIRHVEAEVEVVVGYAEHPRYGYYNGGLTLLNTRSTEALGEYAAQLGHLSFKVKHDRLEHTLTRDNVLQDENWHRVMQVLLRARGELQQALLSRTEAQVVARAPLGELHGYLAAECRTPDGDAVRDTLSARALFLDHAGRPLTLKQIAEQERQVGSVLVAAEPSPLHEALERLGVLLVADAPETRALLLACEEPPLFVYFWNRRKIERAEAVFVMPSPVQPTELTAAERKLLDATSDLLRAAVGLRFRLPRSERVLRLTPSEASVTNRLSLLVGDFPASRAELGQVLALNGPRDGRVFQRANRTRVRLPSFLHWRTLLVNRHHPLFRAQLLASGEDLQLAALGLAQALLHVEGVEGERAFRQMIEAVAEAAAAGSR